MLTTRGLSNLSTYKIFKEKIKEYVKTGIDLKLDRLEVVLNLLKKPQEKLKCIHVAGTNGKGSVCTILSHILKNSGYKVGLFISPHVIDFKERIQINNEFIKEEDFFYILSSIEPLLVKLKNEENILLTEFEVITTIAFLYFFEKKCDLVILETGLGGRLDATNVIKKPLVSLITSISKDHTNILGKSLEEIALEKAGIIKENAPIICNCNISKEALEVIKKVAESKNSEFIISKNNIKVLKESYKKTLFEVEKDIYRLSLPGMHQILNISTVFACLEKLKKIGYEIPKNAVKLALKEIKHPSRLEILSENPTIILDGAHNEEGIESLKKYILKYFRKKTLYAVVGFLQDKFLGTALKEILPIFKRVILVKVNNERSFSLLELSSIVKKYNKNTYCAENFKTALNYAKNLVKNEDDIIFIFGSLYLAEEVRNYLFKKV